MTNLISKEELALMAKTYALDPTTVNNRHAASVALDLSQQIPDERKWPDSGHIGVLIECLLNELIGGKKEVRDHQKVNFPEKFSERDIICFDQLPPTHKHQENLSL